MIARRRRARRTFSSVQGIRGLVADTRPLRNDHFRRLWLANIVTVVGAQLTVVAVPAQIYAETGSSAYVGLTGLFGLVPLVVFGLWGGALADAFDRRTILVCHHGRPDRDQRAVLAAGRAGHRQRLAAAVPVLGPAGLLRGQPADPQRDPAQAPARRLLPAAISLNITMMQAGAIAGPLVAGALIPFVGFSWLYLVDTITLFATLVRRRPAAAPARRPGGHRHPRAALGRRGAGLPAGHPVLLMSFVVDLIAMVFGMPRALFPEIAHETSAGRRAAAWPSRCSSPRSPRARCSAGSSPAGSRGWSCRAGR